MSAARRENIEKEGAKGEKNCQSWNGTKQQVFVKEEAMLKKVGAKEKNVGDNLKNVGDFSKNLPRFLR